MGEVPTACRIEVCTPAFAMACYAVAAGPYGIDVHIEETPSHDASDEYLRRITRKYFGSLLARGLVTQQEYIDAMRMGGEQEKRFADRFRRGEVLIRLAATDGDPIAGAENMRLLVEEAREIKIIPDGIPWDFS